MNKHRRFFHELTPFAKALARIQTETPAVDRREDKNEKIIAAQLKRERRMARNVKERSA